MRLIFAGLLGAALAWFTYWRLERVGARGWVAALCRTIAWAVLLVLVMDLVWSTPGGPGGRPLVLLDGSLSMMAAGGRWREAQDSARAWGEVRRFGDDRHVIAESLPTAGLSDLADALGAASASARPLIVVSDGEITDAETVLHGMLERAEVRLFPREIAPSLAVVRLEGPVRVTVGDTARLVADLRRVGAVGDTARVEVRADGRPVLRRTLRMAAEGESRIALDLPTGALRGDVVLTVTVSGSGDREPRDDTRWWLLRVSPTPGIVVLASPPDWDSRFLLRTLRDVADLPVRGFVQIEPGLWREAETLRPVGLEAVRQAARGADVLVLKGAPPAFLSALPRRAEWRWPSGEGLESLLPGEWYARSRSESPVGAALLGMHLESLPPLGRVIPIEPGEDEWVGMMVQLARRGAERPIMTGRVTGGRRIISTAADGFWRWAFRGGSSEQAYRAVVSSAISWLVGGTDSTGGLARPVRAVVPNARPVVFERIGRASSPVVVTLVSEERSVRDTLRFSGDGRSESWLPPGSYRYTVDGGGAGTVVVEEWSAEWLPRGRALEARIAASVPSHRDLAARQALWLFALCLLALTGEWLARRRLGLR